MKGLRKRILNIGIFTGIMAVCFMIVLLVVTGINHFKLGSQLASINHVTNLSHLVVKQQAKLFSLMLQQNTDAEILTDTLNTFAQENFIIDAHLYSRTGSLIARSQNALPFIPSMHYDNEKQSTQQIVEPILFEQKLIGFLRVTFDIKYGQTTQNKVNELFHLVYGELIILFLTGGVAFSSFVYLRRNKILPPFLEHLSIHSLKGQHKRFYSRRRTFNKRL